jgi:hypothetical protein
MIFAESMPRCDLQERILKNIDRLTPRNCKGRSFDRSDLLKEKTNSSSNVTKGGYDITIISDKNNRDMKWVVSEYGQPLSWDKNAP